MAKPTARDGRHLLHHDGQRLAHVDGRFDVDAAGGGQRRDQLELFAHRIEPAAHQRHLGIDHARRTIDQQPLGGAGRAGQHDDVGDARDQRERDEGKRHRCDQRQPPGPAGCEGAEESSESWLTRRPS